MNYCILYLRFPPQPSTLIAKYAEKITIISACLRENYFLFIVYNWIAALSQKYTFIKSVRIDGSTTTRFISWNLSCEIVACVRSICAVSQSTELYQDAWRVWRKWCGMCVCVCVVWVCRCVYRDVRRVWVPNKISIKYEEMLGLGKTKNQCYLVRLWHTELMKLWDITPFKPFELPSFSCQWEHAACSLRLWWTH